MHRIAQEQGNPNGRSEIQTAPTVSNAIRAYLGTNVVGLKCPETLPPGVESPLSDPVPLGDDPDWFSVRLAQDRQIHPRTLTCASAPPIRRAVSQLIRGPKNRGQVMYPVPKTPSI
jgi:hypothetical protein